MFQPLHLRRTGSAPAVYFAAVTIEDDDVPVATIITVIALSGLAEAVAEVGEVALGVGCVVIIVIANSRIGARFMAAPGWLVAVFEILQRGPAGLDVVAGSEDRARDVVQQVGGSFVPFFPALNHIAGADKDGRTRGWRAARRG